MLLLPPQFAAPHAAMPTREQRWMQWRRPPSARRLRCTAAQRRELRRAVAAPDPSPPLHNHRHCRHHHHHPLQHCLRGDGAAAGRHDDEEEEEDDAAARASPAAAAMFREQVNTIAAWFEQWNECEQTVALYSLLKRLAPAKARFLAVALDQSLADCSELQLHEHQANNPGFVGSLLAETKETALEQLLLHLPLLRPGNYEAKSRYLDVVHKVLSHSVETGAHIEEARQLLSYSLIHPAISNDDRRSLTQWLRHLEDRMAAGSRLLHFPCSDSTQQQQQQQQQQLSQHSGGGCGGSLPNGPGGQSGCSSSSGCGGSSSTSSWGSVSALHFGPQLACHGPHPAGASDCSVGQLNGHFLVQNCSSAPLISSQGSCGNYTNGSHPRVRRSNSLTPPVSINQSSDLWSSQDDLSGRQKPRSFSLSSEHAPPLSPQSSLASSGSGSESHLDELRQGFVGDATGMKDVPSWLKSLRLHKYVSLFAQLSYDEMLTLTDEKLAAQGVTKGARHKIILSIRKLKERYHTLCQLEKDVSEGTNLCAALEELKNILLSPIKARDAGPAQALLVPTLSPALPLSPVSTSPSPLPAGGTSTSPSPAAAGATVTPTVTLTVTAATSPCEMSQEEAVAAAVDATTACQERDETDKVLQVMQEQCEMQQLEREGESPRREGEAAETMEGSTEDGDIPAQFTRVMGKVCTQLLVSNRAEEEAARLFMRLLERALQHEAFTAQQKRRLTTWKLQVQDVWSPLTAVMAASLGPSCTGPGMGHRGGDQRHSRHRWHSHSQFGSPSLPHHPHHHHHNGFPHHLPLHRPQQPQPSQQSPSAMNRFPPPPPPMPGSSSCASRALLNKTASPLPAFSGGGLFPPSPTGGPSGSQPPIGSQHRNSLTVLGAGAGQTGQFLAKRPSLQDPLPEPMDSHSTLQRTRSAPLKPSHFCGLGFSSSPSPSTSTSTSSRTPSTDASGANDPEINSRLESLCLSMTEHALGGFNEV